MALPFDENRNDIGTSPSQEHFEGSRNDKNDAAGFFAADNHLWALAVQDSTHSYSGPAE